MSGASRVPVPAADGLLRLPIDPPYYYSEYVQARGRGGGLGKWEWAALDSNCAGKWTGLLVPPHLSVEVAASIGHCSKPPIRTCRKLRVTATKGWEGRELVSEGPPNATDSLALPPGSLGRDAWIGGVLSDWGDSSRPSCTRIDVPVGGRTPGVAILHGPGQQTSRWAANDAPLPTQLSALPSAGSLASERRRGPSAVMRHPRGFRPRGARRRSDGRRARARWLGTSAESGVPSTETGRHRLSGTGAGHQALISGCVVVAGPRATRRRPLRWRATRRPLP